MTVESFLDTHLFVYAAAGRGPDESKRRRSVELIREKDFWISAQVLQEYYYGSVVVRNPFLK